MNCLIIYAHPHSHSFNHSLLEAVGQKLTALGATVCIRDLYSLQFNPVYGIADIEAARHGTVPADVRREQEFVDHADRVIFVSPLWTTTPPAMLKGYVDRVLNPARHSAGLGHVAGLLSGKKFAMFSTPDHDIVASVRKAGIHAVPANHGMPAHHDTSHHQHEESHTLFKVIGSPLSFHRVLHASGEVSEATRRQLLSEAERLTEQFVGEGGFCPYY